MRKSVKAFTDSILDLIVRAHTRALMHARSCTPTRTHALTHHTHAGTHAHTHAGTHASHARTHTRQVEDPVIVAGRKDYLGKPEVGGLL